MPVFRYGRSVPDLEAVRTAGPLAKLPDALAQQLAARPQTGDGYWVVVVRLWDGREIGGIGIVDGEVIRPPVRIETSEVVAIGLETGEWLYADESARPQDR
jgi:hypothetical protein